MNFSKQSDFLRCLDHLNFLCIFHKQAGSGFESGSEIKVKVGSGSGKIISDAQHCLLRLATWDFCHALGISVLMTKIYINVF
jgi:hypothetical protein